MQTGAVKKTTVTGEYMHVVCAMWNPVIDNEVEPYVLNKSLLDEKVNILLIFPAYYVK
jgi:hypothetical protein